jgi:hypothetical protein
LKLAPALLLSIILEEDKYFWFGPTETKEKAVSPIEGIISIESTHPTRIVSGEVLSITSCILLPASEMLRTFPSLKRRLEPATLFQYLLAALRVRAKSSLGLTPKLLHSDFDTLIGINFERKVAALSVEMEKPNELRDESETNRSSTIFSMRCSKVRGCETSWQSLAPNIFIRNLFRGKMQSMGSLAHTFSGVLLVEVFIFRGQKKSHLKEMTF